jgi:hypothetical protein
MDKPTGYSVQTRVGHVVVVQNEFLAREIARREGTAQILRLSDNSFIEV